MTYEFPSIQAPKESILCKEFNPEFVQETRAIIALANLRNYEQNKKLTKDVDSFLNEIIEDSKKMFNF